MILPSITFIFLCTRFPTIGYVTCNTFEIQNIDPKHVLCFHFLVIDTCIHQSYYYCGVGSLSAYTTCERTFSVSAKKPTITSKTNDNNSCSKSSTICWPPKKKHFFFKFSHINLVKTSLWLTLNVPFIFFVMIEIQYLYFPTSRTIDRWRVNRTR